MPHRFYSWAHNRLPKEVLDTSVQVWNATSDGDAIIGGNVFLNEKPAKSVTSVAWSPAVVWSPDGLYIASAGEDGIVRIWNASTGKSLFSYCGHSDMVNAVAWSPSGAHIASAGNDSTVHIFDATTGEKELVYHRHSGSVNSIAWSPDSLCIASASDDKMVHVWKVS